ncbi:MAG: hypothetical protein GQ569_03720 [Methylococcaceae bacterium]|nr:hypothetical protein [Methylococcaceae bacterium]
MKAFKHYFIYLLLMLCCQNVLAEMVAKVIFAKGKTYVIDRTDKQSDLKKGASLKQGDTIITKDNSRLDLRFTDGGKIAFYDNSEFKIDDYHFSKGNNDKAFFTFVKGIFRTVVGSIKKERYQVKTNVAAIGTRGTEYLAELGSTLQVDVFEGTVILKNQAGDFAVAAGHSALMSDMLSTPEFIALENRNYNQSGDRNGQHPEETGEQGGESHGENHNESAPPKNNSSSNNPRHREQDSHRRDAADPSNITIENILNGTISIESLESAPPSP